MASWSNLSTRQKVALVVGVSAGAAVLGVCYARHRGGPDEQYIEDISKEQLKAPPHAANQIAQDSPQDNVKNGKRHEKTSMKKGESISSFRSHRKEIIARKKGQPRTSSAERPPNAMLSTSTPNEKPREKREIADATFVVGKFVVPSPDFSFQPGEFVEVNVSASESPEHFWIQILGPRSAQLDKLTNEMSRFYQGPPQHKPVAKVQVGDIVAAPFRNDPCWYRAQVQGCLESGNVDLYYVDYGDSWETSKENLFPLRSDFVSLPFQAVECGLSNISPKGGRWSEEALDMFDALSHCASWKPLLAKISSFPSTEVPFFQVQLYDSNCHPMLDIGQELIQKGVAVERQSSPVKVDDDMLVSRLLEEVTNLSKNPELQSFTSREQEELQKSSSSPISADDVIVVDDD